MEQSCHFQSPHKMINVRKHLPVKLDDTKTLVNNSKHNMDTILKY